MKTHAFIISYELTAITQKLVIASTSREAAIEAFEKKFGQIEFFIEQANGFISL